MSGKKGNMNRKKKGTCNDMGLCQDISYYFSGRVRTK